MLRRGAACCALRRPLACQISRSRAAQLPTHEPRRPVFGFVGAPVNRCAIAMQSTRPPSTARHISKSSAAEFPNHEPRRLVFGFVGAPVNRCAIAIQSTRPPTTTNLSIGNTHARTTQLNHGNVFDVALRVQEQLSPNPVVLRCWRVRRRYFNRIPIAAINRPVIFSRR